MFDKIAKSFQKLIHFLSVGIWRVDIHEKGFFKSILYNITKTFVLTYRNIDLTRLNSQASALTYNSILSIVPLLAVLFAISRGFGLQNIVQDELLSYFSGQRKILEKVMTFIDSSLEYAQSGVFIGVGVILLLYTVMNLISSIEDNFNLAWKVKNGRTYFRQFTDYLALILITPVFIICNSGLSIILNSTLEKEIIGSFISPFITVLPFLITILLFTIIYIYIPNTKVKFSSALFGSIIAGGAFQIFQMLYIGGQIWISKYNAIYGSFAAIPLLLLWMQLSWFIVLIGVELSFSFQNVGKFYFEKDTGNISRRYKDFVRLMIATLIIKRFEKGEKPYTANELSEKYKIPTSLTSETVYFLEEIGILIETPSNQPSVPAYVPTMDINQINIAYFFSRIDLHGSEDLDIDIAGEFSSEWKMVDNIRNIIDEKGKNILLKDL